MVTQGHANIKIDGRDVALSLYLVTVGESGERKSAVDDIVLAAILRWQKQLWQVYQSDLATYQLDLDARKNRKTRGETSQGNVEPTPPIQPLMLIEEPTYEGLVKYLELGQPSIGLFSDEGGRFLGGSAMSRENTLKTLAGLSSLWDAKPNKPVTRVRSGDGMCALYGRRVSLHLMIQESVYSQISQQTLLDTQGFLPRCLTTFPESTAGSRLYASEDASKAPEIIDF